MNPAQNHAAPDRFAQERKARRLWLTFILMFFVGQAVLWTYALRAVAGDPSHAIVDDYDSFATQWDQTQAQQAASEALGWHVTLSADHERLVAVLTDADGRPVDAVLSAKIFHKARAAEVQDVQFSSAAPGEHVGLADLERSGIWRVRLTATRGDDVFMQTEDITVGAVARR